MLKTMSAMLDNFDTQMVDYMADIDMQVQAFSSEPWLHDEAKMEEDAPGLKHENFADIEEGSHDQGDVTIEIEMEDNGVEYDMVDDEQLHPESLDVEVYDASLAQSPAMGAFDSVLPAESAFSAVEIPPTELLDTDVTNVSEDPIPAELIAASVAPPVLTPVHEDIIAPAVSDSHRDVSPTDETSNAVFSTSISQDVFELVANTGSEEPAPLLSTDAASAEPVEEELHAEVSKYSTVPDLQPKSVEDSHPSVVARDEELPPGELETSHTSEIHVQPTSPGDPLEISEGVYIDPPPAVLLTIFSDDNEYEFCLFNEPLEWRLPSSEHHADTHRTLLTHLPTMYYESLSSLFDALRRDEFIQSMFHLSEVELVLLGVDLGLTISEDNIYSRDVSLHDLNMLHDGSGIGGPLRMKLYGSSPRFITQYQQLQEHVSRLQLDHQALENHDNPPDHQEVRTEGELETDSTVPLASGQANKDSEDPAEKFSKQNYQVEQVTDSHEHEHDNGGNENGGTPAGEKEDQISRNEEEESPTEPVEENDHDSAHVEGDIAVIGLDFLEAEPVHPQRDGDEHDDDAAASSYNGSEEGYENEQRFTDNIHGTPDGVAQIADGKYELDQEPEERADEQGDEISYGHFEYPEIEAESEPLPDQFQALPQDVDNRSDEYTKEIDPTTPSLKTEGTYTEEEPLPELPTDPIFFDDDNWDQELENADNSWNDGNENENISNHSSVTLSSRGSKRAFDEYESGGETYDEEEQQWELPGSPDSKRTRTR